MADNVIIQNGAGEEVIYENVSGVELLNEDGETATFVHDAEILYENLPDKPFGNIPVVLEETELSFELDESYGIYDAAFSAASEPIPDETYKVNWDGTEYLCVCRSDKIHEGIADTEAVLYWFGNQTLFWNLGYGDDTGEPFCIWFDINDAGELIAIIETLDTSATHTVSITPVNEVTKIDKKYLPDDIGTDIPVFDLAAMGLPAIPVNGTQVSVECDLTEIKAAMANGLIKIKANVDIGSMVLAVESVVAPIHTFANNSYSATFTAMMDNTLDMCYIQFYNGQITAQVFVLTATT